MISFDASFNKSPLTANMRREQYVTKDRARYSFEQALALTKNKRKENTNHANESQALCTGNTSVTTRYDGCRRLFSLPFPSGVCNGHISSSFAAKNNANRDCVTAFSWLPLEQALHVLPLSICLQCDAYKFPNALICVSRCRLQCIQRTPEYTQF